MPTEKTHIGKREEREGVRLTCQVKVKENMKLEIEPEVFDVRRWKCRVRSNENVATYIKELILELPEGEEVPIRAGGYIQIERPGGLVVNYKDFIVEDEYRGDWDRFDFRPRRANQSPSHPSRRTAGRDSPMDLKFACPPSRSRPYPKRGPVRSTQAPLIPYRSVVAAWCFDPLGPT